MIIKIQGLFLLLCLPGMSFSGHAQTGQKPGTIKVQADPKLESLIERQVRANEIKQTMPGYRVQLYGGLVRNTANETRNEFAKTRPEIPSYLIYQQPNFKVRVGDFKSRLEALKLHEEIKAYFPSSFVVKDDVKLPDFGQQ